MPHVLDLTDVLQLIINRLDQGSLAQHQMIEDRLQTVLHILPNLGDEFNILLFQDFL
jgi:hypothetical protein